MDGAFFPFEKKSTVGAEYSSFLRTFWCKKPETRLYPTDGDGILEDYVSMGLYGSVLYAPSYTDISVPNGIFPVKPYTGITVVYKNAVGFAR